MSQENVETAKRGYAMFREGDLAGIAALFADDAELADGGGLGVRGSAAGTRTGPEGFIRAAQAELAHLWEFRRGEVIRGEVYESVEAARAAENL